MKKVMRWASGRNLSGRRKFPRRVRQILPLVFCMGLGMAAPSFAYDPAISAGLRPHKALYDVELLRTENGAQVTNVQGKMLYEWQSDCDGWLTTHKFDLHYDYADAPSMRMTSGFATFEDFDGRRMTFTSKRARDGHIYQKLRGEAHLNDGGEGSARYTLPDGLEHVLPEDTLFPVAHTLKVMQALKGNKKFYTATVYDGSDEEGAVLINAFLGKQEALPAALRKDDENINADLITDTPRLIHLAFFPADQRETLATYEMDMLMHENGIISDMVVEYDHFTVRQRLKALEKLESLCHE
jgi:hypothetical protein